MSQEWSCPHCNGPINFPSPATWQASDPVRQAASLWYWWHVLKAIVGLVILLGAVWVGVWIYENRDHVDGAKILEQRGWPKATVPGR